MKIVFIGFYHRVDDPRLFYRQMTSLRASCRDTEFFFLTPHVLYDLSASFDESGVAVSLPAPTSSEYDRRLPVLRQIPKLRRLRPSVIQASDPRELIWAFILRFFTGAEVVYDSHEDYFNQIFEYSGKTLGSFVKATVVTMIEIIFARFCRAVFCTDDFLLEKYTKRIYGCRNVGLLRNFPSVQFVTSKEPIDAEKDTLNLVYVGSVNKHRGIVDCADYVARFNARHNPERNLTFTVYSSLNPIIVDLLERKMVRHCPWLDYAELMQQLSAYDIGVCLWHRLKKFERNLPIKNFDYMAAGLPVVTSNFGNLEKYARLSGGAICIDPMDYSAFEAAMLELFDPLTRRRLGGEGRSFIKKKASFEVEAVEYVKIMTQLE